jgi:hypothetical protein
MNKQKGHKSYKREGRKGDEDTKGVKNGQKKNTLPIIFARSCTNSNITEENYKHHHKNVRRPSSLALLKVCHLLLPHISFFIVIPEIPRKKS